MLLAVAGVAASAESASRDAVPVPYHAIEAVELTPDGKTLVSADSAGVVRQWSLATHALLRTETIEGTTSVVFSPDGRTLAAETFGGVELWDIRAGRPLGWLYRNRTSANAIDNRVAFGGDGREVVTLNQDANRVLVWDVRTRRRVGRPIRSEVIGFGAVALSSDGARVAVSNNAIPGSATLQVSDVRTGKLIPPAIRIGDVGVVELAFSPGGRTLATATATQGKHAVGFWDIRTGKHLASIANAWHVSYSADGKKIVTGDGDGMVRIRDARSERQIGRALLGDAGIALSRDGCTLAAGSVSGIVEVYDVRSGAQTGVFPNAVEDVAFSPDGGTLAAASYGGTVRLWDMRSRAEVGPAIRASANGPLDSPSVAFSPDGQTLATAAHGIRLWSVATHAPLGTPLAGTEDATRVAFSPDGHTIAAVDRRYWVDQPLLLRDLSSGDSFGLPLVVPHDFFYVSAFAFSPDGRRLAVAGSDESTDQSISVFDLATRKAVSHFGDAGELTQGLVFSPDGRTLAAAGAEGVTLWDAVTGAALGPALDADVTAVAFSPDGKLLAAGHADGSIQLWSVATQTESGAPLRGGNAVTSIAFSPDGRSLASASLEGVRLWDVATRAPIGEPLAGP